MEDSIETRDAKVIGFEEYRNANPDKEITLQGYIQFSSEFFNEKEKIQAKEIDKGMGNFATNLSEGEDNIVTYAAEMDSPRLQLWTLASFAQRKAAFLAQMGGIKSRGINEEGIIILERLASQLENPQGPPPKAA